MKASWISLELRPYSSTCPRYRRLRAVYTANILTWLRGLSCSRWIELYWSNCDVHLFSILRKLVLEVDGDHCKLRHAMTVIGCIGCGGRDGASLHGGMACFGIGVVVGRNVRGSRRGRCRTNANKAKLHVSHIHQHRLQAYYKRLS